MAAKAKLIEFLAAGLEDTNGNPLSGYKVRTLASDGSTAKVLWEDRDKTLPTGAGKSAFTLDSTGRAVVYGDGVYVIKVWTSTADPNVDNPYKTYPANSYKDDNTPVGSEAFYGNVTAEVATLAALRAFDRNGVVDAVYMRARSTAGDGGHGTFRWDASDLSASVTADTQSGIYVAPNSDLTGASGAWVRLYMGRVNARWYGAVGDNVTNDTTAMQGAHSTGKMVYYPQGKYKFTAITMASGGIVGDGPTLSILNCTDATSANAISYTGPLTDDGGGLSSKVPTFRDFTLNGGDLKTTGGGLQFAPVTGETSYIHMENVHISYFPVCVASERASLFKIIGCDFLAYRTAGITVANSNDVDSGDSVVMGCVFNNPYATGSGIIHFSSGGLKVIGNKFLGGLRGYDMQLNSTTKSTSVLVISGNSIENMVGACIALQRTAGTYTYSNIIINGNEFGVGPVGIQSDANSFIDQLTIGGNVFNINASASSVGVDLAGITDFLVSGNTFRGNGGTSTGISVAASCSNGKIGINNYSNLTDTINNLSATVIVAKDMQSGTATTSTVGWSAYGPLFISPVTAVVFPQPFTETPDIKEIKVQANLGNGTVSGIVNTSSTTGFEFVAISSITGIAASVDWVAFGIK